MQQKITVQKKYRSLLKALKYAKQSRRRLLSRASSVKQIKNTKVFFMYKKKAWVLKSWFMKKYRSRNDKLSRTKDWRPRDYNSYTKDSSFSPNEFLKSNLLRQGNKKGRSPLGASLDNLKKGSTIKEYRRHKISIDSYLSKSVKKTSRLYSYKAFGKEKLKRFKSTPFKLSMSRFLANKVFRSFYNHLSKKCLMSMHKKIKNKKNALKGNKKIGSIKNLRKVFAEPLSKNKDDLRLVSTKVQRSANLGDKYEKVNLIRIKKKCIEKSRQEKSKTFLTMIEQRLDSTLLRLMHFKPTHVKHSLSRRKSEGDRNTGYKKPKNLVCANPLSSFTPFQVKQMISHGRVFINDQKVKSNNFQIKPLDKIQIKGFVKKISNSKTYKNQELSVEKSGKVYPKNLKEKKSCLSLLKKGLKKAGLTNRKKDQIVFKNWDIYKDNQNKIFENENSLGKKWTSLFSINRNAIHSFGKPSPKTEELAVEGLSSNVKVLDQNFNKTLVMKKLKDQDFVVNLESSLKKGSMSLDIESDSQDQTCQFLRSLKLKRFTEAFYVTYRNLFLFDRRNAISSNENKKLKDGKDRFNHTFLEPSTEEQVKILFDSVGSDQSVYKLWSLSPLLKSNDWDDHLKKGLAQSVFKKDRIHNSRLKRKLRWFNKKGYNSNKLVKFIRLYYRKKSNVNRFIALKDKWQKNPDPALKGDSKKRSVSDQIISLSKKNSSWLNFMSSRHVKDLEQNDKRTLKDYGNKRAYRTTQEESIYKKNSPLCYASLVYGSRSSNLIRWQQFNKGSRTRLFYNRVLKGGRASDKLNFFELELEFIQLIYENYSGYSR